MDEITRALIPECKRPHTLVLIEWESEELWIDLTHLRKCRTMDGAKAYKRLGEEAFKFDRYIRAGLLRKERSLY